MPIRPQNDTGAERVEYTILQEVRADVNSDDFAQDQPRLHWGAILVPELDDIRYLALEINGLSATRSTETMREAAGVRFANSNSSIP